MTKIDRKPLYICIKEDIERKIAEGTLKPGDKLMSEPELAKELGVSRPKLREALKILQIEGVLISKNGVGTYVNNKVPLIENPLNTLQSIGKMIRNAGYMEGETSVSVYVRESESEWKEKLQTDEDVVIIERIRTANENKVAFVYNIIPCSIAGSYLNNGYTGAIFDLFENKIGIKIAYSITEVCAASEYNEVDKRAKELLGSEVIFLKQLHFDEVNRPVFYSLDYLKTGIFKLFIKRERWY